MNSMAKQFKNLEFNFDEVRELWVIKLRSNNEVVVTFRTSSDHNRGWCIKSDDSLKLWKQCTREYFQELQDLTNYGLEVLEAWTKHEDKAV
jgi:hypothetical protein